eukprot:TRINITY_DN6520_c0_g1_i2.p1 TRINITY_DN6520_c0_g1~~TRINITY_DN6520_c0_g1_i2.p1  ORF type:complete len:303 (+),score=44.84 TRINITY_DN6520_c0_g1_i2:192-1100(+)
MINPGVGLPSCCQSRWGLLSWVSNAMSSSSQERAGEVKVFGPYPVSSPVVPYSESGVKVFCPIAMERSEINGSISRLSTIPSQRSSIYRPICTRRMSSFPDRISSMSGLKEGLEAAGKWVVRAMEAVEANLNRQEAMVATRKGMQLFVKGDVEGSLAEFDRALELDADHRPFLWQRGLSLFYADRFEEAAQQFRDDVAVNPNDTEEAIWCFFSEARLTSVESARKHLLLVGIDPRKVMRAVYELARTGSDTSQVESLLGREGSHSDFYGRLYLGLYHEACGNDELAKRYILAATKTEYAARG